MCASTAPLSTGARRAHDAKTRHKAKKWGPDFLVHAAWVRCLSSFAASSAMSALALQLASRFR